MQILLAAIALVAALYVSLYNPSAEEDEQTDASYDVESGNFG